MVMPEELISKPNHKIWGMLGIFIFPIMKIKNIRTKYMVNQSLLKDEIIYKKN